MILAIAPKKNDIQIGDFVLTDNTFVSPSEFIDITQIRGQVCGFYNNGNPMICAIETFQGKWNSKIDLSHSQDIFTSLVELDRYLKRTQFSESFVKNSPSRPKSKLFQICKNYRKNKNERWYFGSIEENITMLYNIRYLNAARFIAHVGAEIQSNKRYWSSLEIDSSKTLSCTYKEYSVCMFTQYKGAWCNVVPFFKCVEIRNPLQSKIRNLVTKCYKLFKIK